LQRNWRECRGWRNARRRKVELFDARRRLVFEAGADACHHGLDDRVFARVERGIRESPAPEATWWPA